MHPSASGHQLLAELLAGLLTVAADEVASGRELSARSDPRLEGLPPPMIPNYQQQRASLCMQQVCWAALALLHGRLAAAS